MMFVILLLLLLLVPDLYLWHHLMRQFHWAWQLVYWLPLLATIIMMTLMRSPVAEPWMFRCMSILVLCVSLPKLFFFLFSIIGQILGRVIPVALKVMDGAGITVASAMLCIIIYGLFIGWKQLTVNEVELTFDDLPKEFDGYRIVQLSDMHIGTYDAAPEIVDDIADRVNTLNADLICFTGDLVNGSPDELAPYIKTLSRMKAKDGIYSIMGNHDYCMYGHAKKSVKQEISRLQSMEREMGWHLLLNDNVMLHRGNDSIMLAGVENSSKPPFPDYGDLTKALSLHKSPSLPEVDPRPSRSGSLPSREGGGRVLGPGLFTILLSHDPTHWQREVLPESSVQLQLSGHTHSTQFRMFGWSPASFTYKEYAGTYEMFPDGTETFNPETPSSASRKLFVCTGTGGNLPFRVGVKPEIVVITLRCK